MAGKLTAVGVKSEKLAAGLHSDGDGLYLSVTATSAKSWRFIWRAGGKRREMGLGSFPTVSLAEARDLAAAARKVVAGGGDPIAERKAAKEKRASVPTFAEAAKEFIDGKQTGWRNEKHRQQWRNTLTTYCASFADKLVSDITTDHVLAALKPIWKDKAETAGRVRGRVEAVLDFAKVKKWREGENSARWRGNLQSILPARDKLQRGHHKALGYKEVPGFLTELRDREAMAARALEFLVLAAARSGEVREATWSEFDLDAAVWTVPANRMKAGKTHRVPLVGRALEILTELAKTPTGDFVFPGQKLDKPLSVMALDMLLRRMDRNDITVHGFRSSFRDWAGDATSFPRDLAEAALAHRAGDATEIAYRRGDALEKRRAMMLAWDAHCTSKPAGENVVPLAKREAAGA